jgi:hypothetical protein
MILFVMAAVALLGVIVQQLWNWLVPAIIGWHAIKFWQAVGLLVLTRILFGGFRGRGGMHWRHRLAERWERMSPEEREKFTRGMRGRCGGRQWQPEEQKV